MGERRETCSNCRKQLLVPPKATTLRCIFCDTLNPIRPLLQPVNGRVHEPVQQVSDLFKGFFNNMSSTLLSINTYPGTTASPAPPPAPAPWYAFYGPIQQPIIPHRSVHGRKRAVLCGVSYRGKNYELKGTINDVNCMRFLLEKLGFPSGSIIILTEDEKDPTRIPTKQNIRQALRWLIYGSQSGDSLVFHYSGHGTQQPDTSGDERDGYDETLCPVDYETKGMIIDDEINQTIVRPLPWGATLHAIIDSCHSGTVLDLPFLCKMEKDGYSKWEDHSPPTGEYKGTDGGLALCISACDDHQSSVDTTALSGAAMTGALTYSFIDALEKSPQLTYGHLLQKMRSAIRDANRGIRLNGPIATFINRVLFTGFSQEPQLSSSEMFDVYAKQVIL